jgi:hypothetical protein
LLCFDCYRVDLERTRALQAAGELDTASETRFQSQRPFEPVNQSRLRMLKAQWSEARAAASRGIGQFVDKQHHAQIEARHVLQAITASFKARQIAQAMASATHAAESDMWLPFVASR